MDIRHKFLDNCALVIKNSWNCDKYLKNLRKIYTHWNFFSTRQNNCLKILIEILKIAKIGKKFPKFDQLVPVY